MDNAIAKTYVESSRMPASHILILINRSGYAEYLSSEDGIRKKTYDELTRSSSNEFFKSSNGIRIASRKDMHKEMLTFFSCVL